MLGILVNNKHPHKFTHWRDEVHWSTMKTCASKQFGLLRMLDSVVQAEAESQLGLGLATGPGCAPWTRHFTSLSLNFLIFNWDNKTYLMGLNEIMFVKCLV